MKYSLSYLFYAFILGISTTLFMLSCDTVSPCDDVDCGEHGTCAVTTAGTITCACEPGYKGAKCETFDPCLLISCKNGGNCIQDSDTTAHCECPPNYTGQSCQLINGCYLENPCGTHGTCVPNEFGDPTCQCEPGYIGQFCNQIDLCFVDGAYIVCQENASCIGGVCICDSGYDESDNCQSQIRTKFLGTYNIELGCNPNNYTSVGSIVAHPDSVAMVYITRFGQFQDTIVAHMFASTFFEIPTQTVKEHTYYGPAYGALNTQNGSIFISQLIYSYTDINQATQRDTCQVYLYH